VSGALAPQHQALIDASAITADVAAARRYYTATTKTELAGLGFSEAQRRVPALVIPIWDVFGQVAMYQIRSDAPRINAHGKVVKYETPRGSRMVLDVPPIVRDRLGDPTTPLAVTEGVRKADSGASVDLCCIDVLGVWNWRGSNEVGGKTALPDWEHVALNKRCVLLIFDSDVMTKPEVHGSLARFKPLLEARGAEVLIVYLPSGAGGAKVGLDDFLAAGHGVDDLLSRAELELRQPAGHDAENSAPYAATPAGFVYHKLTQNGPVDQPLSNFTARIEQEVIADDGTSERTELVIAGDLGGAPLPRIRVPSRRFVSLDWVNSEWGARPIIAAGFGNRDRVREAIQRHSTDIARRHVYEHPGWRHLSDHGWAYLHAGGAIGAAGVIEDVDVDLRGAAGRIVLPEPPSGEELRAAVRACLSLRDLAPDAITAPLLGAVYRAPLCELVPADTGVFLVGPTGVFKTELSALAMQHVGAGFDRLHLPAQWTATANFLERVAFDFKDAPLVIDDFAPGGSQVDIARLHATADRVFRGVGNRGGRGRMHGDGTVRPDFPPRGIVIATGEDAPRGQSLRSRLMILDITPGDVDRDRLTEAQAAGRQGVCAAAYSGFVRYLAPSMEFLRTRLPNLLSQFRAEAYRDAAHARTPEAVAHLALGWWAFLRFAAEVGALSQPEAQAAFERAWAALGEAATRQSSHHVGEEPARRFLDLLSSALAAGHLHFASTSGGVPASPKAWGWREERIGTGEYERSEWRPQGSRAGWLDGNDLYLDLEAALSGTQRVSQATGNGVAVGPKMLAKRLHERRFLRSTEQEHGDLRIRRTLEGRRRRVLHLVDDAISAGEPGQSGQTGQHETESAPPRGSEPGRGRIIWPDCRDADHESGHGIRPETMQACDSGQNGRIGRILTS